MNKLFNEPVRGIKVTEITLVLLLFVCFIVLRITLELAR